MRRACSTRPTKWPWIFSLQDRIGFLEMSDLIAHCLEAVPFIPEPLADLRPAMPKPGASPSNATPAWNS
jgi:hypothetical protein